MKIDDEAPSGAPDWVLTYGDLMSLLLTIFVMLVSMGELKQTDKFQGVADSLHEQFGHELSQHSGPGQLRPRNPMLAAAAIALRTQREAAMGRGSNPVRSDAGTSISFEPQQIQLSAQSQSELQRLAEQWRGLTQPIEIRGLNASVFAPAIPADACELAYRRARETASFLIEQQGIDAARVRISLASENAAVPITTNPPQQAGHQIEVVLLPHFPGDTDPESSPSDLTTRRPAQQR
jgi:chemotaxis protein MotB